MMRQKELQFIENVGLVHTLDKLKLVGLQTLEFTFKT